MGRPVGNRRGTTASDPVAGADAERYLVVDGRRWRRSDPSIPEPLRTELVAELMAARRRVQVDPDAARPRVQDAKVALGERGRAWWEPYDDEAFRARIAATIRALLRHRAGRSLCPSDVARAVGGEDWRASMGVVRTSPTRSPTPGSSR